LLHHRKIFSTSLGTDTLVTTTKLDMSGEGGLQDLPSKCARSTRLLWGLFGYTNLEGDWRRFNPLLVIFD
jgi:hypothetical protein